MIKKIIFIIIFPINSFAQQWYSMANGVTNNTGLVEVYDIVKFQEKISIGGQFKKSGNTILNSVAQWENNQWNPMGIGIWLTGQPDSLGVVTKFTTYKSKLYCAGWFGGAGGSYIGDTIHSGGCTAIWDGTSWSNLGNLHLSGFNDIVNSMCVYNNNLYYGGYFDLGQDSTGVISMSGFAKWNDTVLKNAGNLNSNYNIGEYYLFSLIKFQGKLIMGGMFTTIDTMPFGTYKFVACWNDTAFNSFASGFNKPVRTLTVYNNELYAAGDFTARGDNSLPLNHVAIWDGTDWQPVGEGLNDTVFTLYVDSVTNKLYAGGRFLQTGLGVSAKHVAEWTGTNWQEVGGGTNGYVLSIYSSDSMLYVGGHFTQVGGTVAANNIAVYGYKNPNVGVNEISNKEEINIYPNPVTSLFTVSTEGTKIKQIKVVDLLGECVLHQQLTTNNQQLTLDMSGFSKGIYFVEAEAGKEIIRKKIIKQ